MSKIGRNEPCPCGSGKKYKKCCIDKEILPVNEIDAMILEGDEFVSQRNIIMACNVWLKVWESLKQKITPEVKSIEELDQKYSRQELVYDWSQEFEMKLGNAGAENPEYYEKRIRYCHEFVDLLPDSDKLIIENMKRAKAESYFALGRLEEGEKAFESLVKDFPNSIWVYIGWGDMYCLYRHNEKIPLDYEKAEKLYREALTKGIDDYDEKAVLERLDDLEAKKKMAGL